MKTPTESPQPSFWRRKRIALSVTALALLAAATVAYLFRAEILPESSPYSRGFEIAQHTACFSCHGSREGDAAFNPSIPPKSPLLESRVPKVIAGNFPIAGDAAAATQQELREWIEIGSAGMASRAQSQRAGRTATQRLFEMPAYGDAITPDQLDDLVTFVSLSRFRHRANSLATRGFGTSSKGEALARTWGCFSCHGELGQGGVRNPGSLKGYIPGFFGHDFATLTRDGNREDIREWIRDGVSKAFIEQSYLGFEPARYFTERQSVKMPAYEKLLSAEDLELLIDYCLQLQQLGPLNSQGVLNYQRQHASAPSEEAVSEIPTATVGAAGDTIDEAFFSTRIKPLLEKHCVECHGPDTADNDYRLDKKELITVGGWIYEDTQRAPFVAGAAEKSLAIHFVKIDSIDEDVQDFPMPPRKKRTALSADEIELLSRWVDGGMPWPDGAVLQP